MKIGYKGINWPWQILYSLHFVPRLSLHSTVNTETYLQSSLPSVHFCEWGLSNIYLSPVIIVSNGSEYYLPALICHNSWATFMQFPQFFCPLSINFIGSCQIERDLAVLRWASGFIHAFKENVENITSWVWASLLHGFGFWLTQSNGGF